MKALIPIIIIGANLTTAATAENSSRYESLHQEIGLSIARGIAWLRTQQKPAGSWDEGDLPALTALTALALQCHTPA